MLNGLFLFTREHYDLNSISTLKLKKIDTVYFGSEDLSSFAKKNTEASARHNQKRKITIKLQKQN